VTVRSSARSTVLAAYVLHSYDWSESSLILDLFTRDEGRVAVAAKGAKKPFSQLRAVLLPFQRLVVTLARPSDEAAEVRNLRGAERAGGSAMPAGAALFSGFYANELLLKLLARHDPHPVLFDAYAATVLALGDPAAAQTSIDAALRAFELVLLREIGLLADLAVETASRRAVDPDRRYAVLPDAGVIETTVVSESPGSAGIEGATLLALQRGLDAHDLVGLRRIAAADAGELRPALRQALQHHLGSPTLRTRQVMLASQALVSS
jgi:DNA repair protein RecO (recombination protein O)